MSIFGSGFVYESTIFRRDGSVEEATDSNLLPKEAVTFLAGLVRGTVSPINKWYLGLFESNTAPDKEFTAAELQKLLTECQAYDEAGRPEWLHDFDGVSVIDNMSNRATFTFNQTKRIYGAFIVSTSTKGGSSGVLLSIARFKTPKDIDAGEPFQLRAGIPLVPANI